ncbi:uncharacterized GPI-anchored protein At1g61900-like [Zingiber officinale]|uniref:uncharacterized GPI-anchored protein At1g61900-like n=1 Tax=Zingiber officinale TaxID=94328 RepID=UPI001C4C5C2E|nr:uncharacterized GPI-anchored protein At1g61900-like [Zingiber officinale]
MEAKETNLLPDTSPNSAPQPFIPLLAPSPMAAPFFHNSTPKLSVDNLLRTTAVDCWASFAPFLANVICCPQFEATLVILIGQASKDSSLLALDSVHANYCLSDIQQILGSQGVPSDLHDICSIRSSNLSEGSCPINDTIGFESVVDSSKLLAACSKVDAVNECCRQICQSAINEAAKNLVLKDGGLMTNMEINDTTVEYSSTVNSCKNIVLRWLSSRLDSSSAKQVLRGLSNCNVNGVSDGGPNVMLHNAPLGEGNLKVSVDVVLQEEAELPIPLKSGPTVMIDAVGTVVGWPKELVIFPTTKTDD